MIKLLTFCFAILLSSTSKSKLRFYQGGENEKGLYLGFNFAVICAEFLSRFLRFLLRFLEFFPREVISGLNKGGAYRISLGKEFGRQARKYLKGMF